MNKDTSSCGGSVAFSQQIEYGQKNSGSNINTSNNVPANHIGALDHQVDQPQYLLQEDLDSLPQQFLSSPQKNSSG